MLADSFKERLKEAIGISSVNSFAKKCDIAEGAVRNYLNGKTTPNLDTLEKIAEVSGYRLAWLASGEGAMKPNDYAGKQGEGGGETRGETGVNVCAGNHDQDTTDPELAELVRLLVLYGNMALKDDIKRRLLKLKAASEG